MFWQFKTSCWRENAFLLSYLGVRIIVCLTWCPAIGERQSRRVRSFWNAVELKNLLEFAMGSSCFSLACYSRGREGMERAEFFGGSASQAHSFRTGNYFCNHPVKVLLTGCMWATNMLCFFVGLSSVPRIWMHLAGASLLQFTMDPTIPYCFNLPGPIGSWVCGTGTFL